MFTWFNGALLLTWILCPLAAIIITKQTNRWLRRRALRHSRPRTVRVRLRADTTQFITELQRAEEDIAAFNARQSDFYKRLDDEGRNDRASSLTRPEGDDE